jgi:uncharacterized protein (TIGR00725 family)
MTHAYTLGTLLGDKEWVVLTGGRNCGVMAQVNKGIKDSERKTALTVGILPSVRSTVSADIDVAVFTDLNNARNNLIGLSCQVLICCGVVGAGTVSELALAVKNAKCAIVVLGCDPASKAFLEKLSTKLAFVSTAHAALALCESLAAAER